MKFLSTTLLATGFLMTSTAQAAELTPFDQLMSEVEGATVFTQFTKDEHCPNAIVLKDVTADSQMAKPGDKRIDLRTANRTPGDGSPMSFTFEGNSIEYRPGLPAGKIHSIDRNLDFPSGVAYTSRTQSDINGVIASSYNAKIFSSYMIGATSFTVAYDSKARMVTYQFRGNGVNDVNCAFIAPKN